MGDAAAFAGAGGGADASPLAAAAGGSFLVPWDLLSSITKDSGATEKATGVDDDALEKDGDGDGQAR